MDCLELRARSLNERRVFLSVLGTCFLSVLMVCSTGFAAPSSQPASRPSKSAVKVKPQVKKTFKPQNQVTSKKNVTPKPANQSKSVGPVRRKKDRLDVAIHKTEELIRRVLWRFGRDPNNPWLLTHSLLAFGKDLKLANGQYAIDRIVSGFLKFKKVGKHDVPYFPVGTNRDRIEPHPSMHVKTFIELGVPLSRVFTVGKRKVTLAQMLKGVHQLFPYYPRDREIGHQAWRFFLLYGHRPNNNKAWVWDNAKGEKVVFLRQVFRLIKYTDKQTSFLRILKNRGVKVIPKLRLRRQHIYGESCGGFHLLQAALRWCGHPNFRKRLQPFLDAQIELMFYRLDGEVKLYTQLFKKYQKHAAYRFLILLQQLKFLGHFLETVTDLHEWGLLKPTLEQRKAIRGAVQLAVVSVMLLYRLGWYGRIPLLQKRSYQMYLDLMGDSAHTLHALRLIKKTNLYRK